MTPLLTALLIATAVPCTKAERVGPCPMAEAAHCKRDSDTRQWTPDLSPCEGSRVPVPVLQSLVRESDQLKLVKADLTREREESTRAANLAAKNLAACDGQVYQLKRTCRKAVDDCAPDGDVSLAVGLSIGALAVGVVSGLLIGMAVDGSL